MTESKKPVRLLPAEEAKKIAAGEVIDRPAALVREFIDNAIDAGSNLVEVNIEGGGSHRIEVIDDGGGMDRDDLELCWQTHATSKIRSIDDLNTTETLGFRGEALAAAAVVSHLEILTSTDGREAWRLEVGPGGGIGMHIEQARRARGTSVRAVNIFDTIPVRKRFLKREWSEANLCKTVFTDKALAFPDISFRFTQDGKLKMVLPAVSSVKERFAAILLNRNEGAFLYEIKTLGRGYSVTIIVGGPELSRNDRRQQFVFANGRRIQEFSLLQALEYGVQGWFPNALHPVGAVFVNIDPSLADFNIHPAKREVRFADLGAIHHTITQAIRDFIHHQNLAVGRQLYDAEATQGFQGSLGLETQLREPSLSASGNRWTGSWDSSMRRPIVGFRDTSLDPVWEQSVRTLAMEALEEHPAERDSYTFASIAEKEPAYSLRFAGRVFNLFIMVEKDDKLYIIDQHAAHERVLYEEFLSKPIPQQELLVAIPFRTESEEEDRFLTSRKQDLARLGIVLEADSGSWRIEALPVSWHLGDVETIKAILNLKNAGQDIAEHWAATLSCHGAVKDGEYLDESTALALADAALRLPNRRCPHGRPIFFEINREELFRYVKRTG